ncbi:L-seryl-tRNA(Sec) selenium transferase [Desulforhopalus sp. IMCC35007]|uniref:L-seryl-tRNA(Sec) selenium transferase n=1 Tax=Desulforhopalus sp. IMCC35007 TaxID=2569543 RepID=UPI0010AEE290|nr:L-seryl-tRNA(Sec) selenium transferase [Desulforhopalus sp. IMCC35007]TKB05565.1 L-seryl-tRNA(Sec) selenium transferase [Desulforhopalus sp. IMCC35007]
MDPKSKCLRGIPKVDECISLLRSIESLTAPDTIIKSAIQEVTAKEREKILTSAECNELTTEQWIARFVSAIKKKISPHLKHVFNGTGVVIHTNLGRSVLPEQTTDQLVQAGGYYSNLEFNLDTGQRGSRYSLVEDIICDLTGAEAALVVNNNAAAVLISLDTLAKGHEVIVSRGQLVEIGGSFRIPDVMAKSGATLVEVGATNRTHLRDYENALTENTAMLLRVHTSNFRIIGFTSDVSATEMVELGRRHGIATMEDLGSGSLVDFSKYGFPKEPTVQEIVKAGVDVVTFSGDKLLGGPQAGIIVGTKEIIGKIKKNPLNRALRIDKFTLAALESVLREYYDMDKAIESLPTLRMLTSSPDIVKKRGRSLLRRIKSKVTNVCEIQLISTVSRVGGGALPEHNIKSWALAFSPKTMRLSDFEKGLRKLATPVIGRMENDKFLLDMRTIQDKEVSALSELLVHFFEDESDRD